MNKEDGESREEFYQ